MDGEDVPISRHVDIPEAELIESCWRLRGAKGRIVSCGIYRNDGVRGLEVRAGFSEQDLLRSELVRDIETARRTADTWRRAVLAKGGFEEVREASHRTGAHA